MRFHVISVFPEMILQALEHGLLGQAVRGGRLEVRTMNPRKFTHDIHQAIDDRPFGGGDGMVMFSEPLAMALREARLQVTLDDRGPAAARPEDNLLPGAPLTPSKPARTIYLSARGRPFNDRLARELSREEEIVLVCGRYGGVDQRLIEAMECEEVTVGDFVLSGGEIGALAVIDAVSRFVPGVLGNAASAENESFAEGLLEHPQFTRPREWNGWVVPEALLSGDHARIRDWRLALAILSTAERRPELLARRGLNAKEGALALATLASLSVNDLRACGLKGSNQTRAAVVAAMAIASGDQKSDRNGER